ncbi:hypothetical protein [Muricoccus radiodurans]|uniref:hypothetical protein n=1 Tax=Muricoccus radiodurans TaxID=2231721 RepID=UPI003CECF5C8
MGDKHNKNEEGTDRSGGGPGSAHQGGNHGHTHRKGGQTIAGPATSDEKSHVSGGGGERDSHHTHDPEKKGDRKGY